MSVTPRLLKEHVKIWSGIEAETRRRVFVFDYFFEGEPIPLTVDILHTPEAADLAAAEWKSDGVAVYWMSDQ